MGDIQNRGPLTDSCYNGSYLSEVLLNQAFFTSPIGYLVCKFTAEGSLISCSPLEKEHHPIQKEWVELSESRHTALAAAIWNCTPSPDEYHPIMPIASWAPHFWEILSEVPFGTTLSYGELAQLNGLGRNMARAIGRLLGTNPIMILYPCHRIIKANGDLASYRWGVEKKRALLEYEASKIITR